MEITLKLVLFTLVTSICSGWLGSWWTLRVTKEKEIKLHARILYYDLLSIEFYFVDAGILCDSGSKHLANIHYFTDWKSSQAHCLFFNKHEMNILSQIYNRIFDYNWWFKDTQDIRKKFQESKELYEHLKEDLGLILSILEKHI